MVELAALVVLRQQHWLVAIVVVETSDDKQIVKGQRNSPFL